MYALKDAVVTNDPVSITVAEPVFTVKANVVLSPLVNVTTLLLTEAVTTAFGVNDAVAAYDADPAVAANDAVATEPDTATLTLKVVPSPLVNVIMFTFDEAVTTAFGVKDAVAADVAIEAVAAYDADITVPLKKDAVAAKVALLAYDAEVAIDAVAAYEALSVGSPIN